MASCGLYVSVPIASFRIPQAREYFESYPCPPPSTAYGMLLSAIGEVDRGRHEGAEIAIGILTEPQYSVVLRTMWRVKNRQQGPGLGTNRRPDYQELLTHTELAVWVRRGKSETAEVPLSVRVRDAVADPSLVERFGALSLGESSHLVDELSLLRAEPERVLLLVRDEEGDLTLPVWPDHVGSSTRWEQYALREHTVIHDLPDEAWTAITRPEY